MANAPLLPRSQETSCSLYQSLGWSIIPADPDTKAALIFWRSFVKKKPGLAEIESWSRRFPRAGIAVLGGPISGLVILDCDGQAGVGEALKKGVPRTPSVATPRGGMHFYFQHPDFAVKNAAKLGASKKIDVRAEGGYVLAPHSRRSDGRRYTWLVSPREAAVAAPPDWFAEMLDGLRATPPSRVSLSSSESGSTIVNDDNELDEVLERLPQRVQRLIVEGCDSSFPSRSECDFFVILSLVAAGVPDDAIECIFDAYTIGEKYREPGQGSRYLGRSLEQAHQKVRVVRVKYADVQAYENGSRLHLALIVEDAPDAGRMIRCGVSVPRIGSDSLSLRWAHLFEAADMPVPIGEGLERRAKTLIGKRLRVQLAHDRENPVVSFHRY
jgi:hypothetical protein